MAASKKFYVYCPFAGEDIRVAADRPVIIPDNGSGPEIHSGLLYQSITICRKEARKLGIIPPHPKHDYLEISLGKVKLVKRPKPKPEPKPKRSKR